VRLKRLKRQTRRLSSGFQTNSREVEASSPSGVSTPTARFRRTLVRLKRYEPARSSYERVSDELS